MPELRMIALRNIAVSFLDFLLLDHLDGLELMKELHAKLVLGLLVEDLCEDFIEF